MNRNQKNTDLNYPTPRKDDISDNFFGTEIADPYRWMESDSAELSSWLDEQVALTDDVLESYDQRAQIAERMQELYAYDALSGAPRVVGDRVLYHIRKSGANQPAYYLIDDVAQIAKRDKSDDRLLLDVDSLSADGTQSVVLSGGSKDGRYLGMLTAHAGSDWHDLEVLDLQTGARLPDKLTGIKFTNVAWLGHGFFYSRYDVTKDEQDLVSVNAGAKIYYHELGQPQEQDRLVFEDPEHPLRYLYVTVTEDEQYVLLYLSEGTDGTEIRYAAANAPEHPDQLDFQPLVEGFEQNAFVFGSIDNELYYVTDQDASNMRLMTFDTRTGEHRELLAEQPFMIEDVVLNKSASKTAGVKDRRVIIVGSQDANSMLKILNLENLSLTDVALPFAGTVGGISSGRGGRLGLVYFGVSSFLRPHEHYVLDLDTKDLSCFNRMELNFDPKRYAAEQHFFTSKDGTRVPIFILHREDFKRDGNNPGFIYGYGGFAISILPQFDPFIIALLEEGFVYASICLRGGLEYGEKWHRAGMLENKQNVFDDMAAGAEYLIEQGYTSPEKLAIHGRSNGGLLVGATINQRPDLFAVSLPQVGVMDMLRFHKFTVGWGWMAEYGNPEQEDDFNNILKYSPLHNIEAKDYPATMAITSDHDDRVVPAHSFKYIATLQEKNQSDQPILLRVGRDAGHGAGNALTKVIREKTDILTFILLNIEP